MYAFTYGLPPRAEGHWKSDRDPSQLLLLNPVAYNRMFGIIIVSGLLARPTHFGIETQN